MKNIIDEKFTPLNGVLIAIIGLLSFGVLLLTIQNYSHPETLHPSAPEGVEKCQENNNELSLKDKELDSLNKKLERTEKQLLETEEELDQKGQELSKKQKELELKSVAPEQKKELDVKATPSVQKEGASPPSNETGKKPVVTGGEKNSVNQKTTEPVTPQKTDNDVNQKAKEEVPKLLNISDLDQDYYQKASEQIEAKIKGVDKVLEVDDLEAL